MLRRQRTLSHAYHAPEPELDALALRIRRLVLHRGFDRAQIDSPMLKRLTPSRDTFGRIVDAGLRQRLKDAQLDANTLSYLLSSAEAELDSARLRLT